jgi:hypothetical protein
MRSRLLLITLALASVAVTAVWLIEKLTNARLHAELHTAQYNRRELGALDAEHARLVTLQPSAADLAAAQEGAAEAAALREAIASRRVTQRVEPFGLGESFPCSSWANRGAATPRAALETAFWAAAGGDLPTLKSLLLLSHPTREKADALLASLPSALQTRYATAEDLVAAFTAKNIPLSNAQLVWFNQTSDDDAALGVLIEKPRSPDRPVRPSSSSAAIPTPREQELRAALAQASSREETIRLATLLRDERAARPSREPPGALDASGRGLTLIALHRDSGAWRLVVPPAAVERIARELRAGPAL